MVGRWAQNVPFSNKLLCPGFVLICTSLCTPQGRLFSFSQFFYLRVVLEFNYELIGAMHVVFSSGLRIIWGSTHVVFTSGSWLRMISSSKVLRVWSRSAVAKAWHCFRSACLEHTILGLKNNKLGDVMAICNHMKGR